MTVRSQNADEEKVQHEEGQTQANRHQMFGWETLMRGGRTYLSSRIIHTSCKYSGLFPVAISALMCRSFITAAEDTHGRILYKTKHYDNYDELRYADHEDH